MTQQITMDAEEIRREVARIPWWHEIDLGHGIITPGRGGSRQLLERMHMPGDLTGRSVLDIGTFDGFFAFEAERRGAARVVAIDHRVPPGFTLAHRVLQSRVEFVKASVMEITPENLGTFDVVFFLGVIYHLPNPIAALDRVFQVTRDLMILETDSALDWVHEPAAQLVSSREAFFDSALNWWIPNTACMVRMCESTGFRRVVPVFAPPPPPRTLARKVLRRLLPRYFGPKSSRLVVHAWR